MLNPDIHIMSASHGEAMILQCSKGDESGVIVIDGGPYVNAIRNPFLAEVEKQVLHFIS